MTTPTADPAPAAASAERPDRSEETRARAEILAPVRPHLAVAAALVFLSSVCTVVPYLLIVEAARVMLADRVDDAWPLLGWAVAVFAARALLYSGALFWTHLVDADNQLNLRRLIALFEELRTDSQLIVITHQKPTRDVANVLYGVTMRGDGITRVISQRMQPAGA